MADISSADLAAVTTVVRRILELGWCARRGRRFLADTGVMEVLYWTYTSAARFW